MWERFDDSFDLEWYLRYTPGWIASDVGYRDNEVIEYTHPVSLNRYRAWLSERGYINSWDYWRAPIPLLPDKPPYFPKGITFSEGEMRRGLLWAGAVAREQHAPGVYPRYLQLQRQIEKLIQERDSLFKEIYIQINPHEMLTKLLETQ